MSPDMTNQQFLRTGDQMSRLRFASMLLGAVVVTSGLSIPSFASVLWNESVSGDLSNNQAAPNTFILAPGTNSVIGSVGTGDTQDWVSVTIPAGDTLSGYVLASYSAPGGDQQGFTGFQVGSAFVGSAFTAGSYAGYAHYGPGATNPSVPLSNVGTDLLPTMAQNGPGQAAAGATGFTQPIGPGSYTFLIQQLGGTTNYQFDFDVSAVPEPASLSMIGLAGMCVLRRRRAR
jgi:hypothetical protein